MAKLTMPSEVAKALTLKERMMLFCAASGTDWQHAGLTGESVTGMVVKEFIERHVGGRLRLTGYGRVVLRAMVPDL